MRQIQIGFENRQDLIINKSIAPGRRPAPVRGSASAAASDVLLLPQMGCVSRHSSAIANDLGADHV